MVLADEIADDVGFELLLEIYRCKGYSEYTGGAECVVVGSVVLRGTGRITTHPDTHALIACFY